MTRTLIYSHDTYGLGHFRRCGLLASGLVTRDSEGEVLIVTGSPRAQAFSLPDRVDTVKLPAATKDDRGRYRPRKLLGPIDRLIGLRSSVIAAAVESFEPDTILVDHAPLGMRGELVPVLDAVQRMARPPRLILGLRDIIDEPERVERAWTDTGVWSALDRYDDIFVYGDPRVATTATELDLPARVLPHVQHTGYVAPSMPEPQSNEPYLLVTPGGGGDGQGLLRAVLDGVEDGATAGMRVVIVTGPLLSARRQAELLVRAERRSDLEVHAFRSDMRALIASSAGVISMAGYNTVVEELAAAKRALLVPRRHPRLEQTLRARRLAPISALEHCPLEALGAERLRSFVDACASAEPRPADLDLRGVARACDLLTSNKKRTTTHV